MSILPTLESLRSPRRLAVVLALVSVAVLSVVLLAGRGPGTRELSAHFSRAVSVYEGTEVRILGVTVGEVTAVVPQGDSVRVDMKYDASYQVPADAKAVIVTPTLVADRFVQLTPVWTGGAVLEDGATLKLPETATPVELDRIYASLQMLSESLGPRGANEDGSLDTLLEAGAEAMDGQGRRANRMILDMADAAEVFGTHRGDLFETVENLDAVTRTLARHDQVVDRFMKRLAGASGALAGEREELRAALVALAEAIGRIEGFVRDNRKALVGEVEDLSVVLEQLAREKDSLATAMEKGPLGASNLALAFDTTTGSIGSRVQMGPNVEDLDGLLCTIVTHAGVDDADLACRIFKDLIEPLGLGLPDVGARQPAPSGERMGSTEPAGSLDELLGAGR